jgi:hypothetical protein
MRDQDLLEFIKSVISLPPLLGELVQELRQTRVELTKVVAATRGQNPSLTTTKRGVCDPSDQDLSSQSKGLTFHHDGISEEKMKRYSSLLIRGLLDNSVYDKTGIGRPGIESILRAEGKKDLIRRVIKPLVVLGVLVRVGKNVKLSSDRSVAHNYLKMVDGTR